MTRGWEQDTVKAKSMSVSSQPTPAQFGARTQAPEASFRAGDLGDPMPMLRVSRARRMVRDLRRIQKSRSRQSNAPCRTHRTAFEIED